MAKLRALAPLCATPLLASCLFLLDYDELQDGRPATPNAGGAAGAPSADAGAAGEASGCGSCDDGDPCTIDTCNDRGQAPQCEHELSEGLKLDGFDATVHATSFLRVSMVAGGGAFYLSAFEANDLAADANLYRLADEGTELEPLAKLSELGIGAGIVSNVGLAVEELAVGDVALHGFVAALPKVGDAPRVFHLERHDGKTDTNVAGMSYLPSPFAFPQALVIGGKVSAAWIQANGTIAVHDASTLRAETFGAATLPATSLSLLSSSDDRPAVLFTVQDAKGAALGAYVETAGANRARVAECETRAGAYVSASVIDTQVPGIWLANITRAGEGYLTTGGATLVCANSACTPVTDTCPAAGESNNARNIAGATYHFEQDETGVVYSVLAVPQILANEADDSADGVLSLFLGRAHFMSSGQVESSMLGGAAVEAARLPTSKEREFAGPDWPAVAILPTHRALIAWIQPSAEGNGNELRVQRYRMCLPPESAASDP